MSEASASFPGEPQARTPTHVPQAAQEKYPSSIVCPLGPDDLTQMKLWMRLKHHYTFQLFYTTTL